MQTNSTAKHNRRTSQNEPEIQSRHHDHIAPGEYLAYCCSAQTYLDDEWRRWQCVLQFDIFDDNGNVIARCAKFFNLGEGVKPRATSRRSHYRRSWISANGNQPPRQGQKLVSSIFLRRFARVTVVDVERDCEGQTICKADVYSKVDTIQSWETGNPVNRNE